MEPENTPLEKEKHQTTGQISIIPKPELRGFWGDSLTKPPFGVTSADVVIICPETSTIFGFHVSFRGCRGFIGGHTLQEAKITRMPVTTRIMIFLGSGIPN